MAAQLQALITILLEKLTVAHLKNSDMLVILAILFQILSEILTCALKMILFHFLVNTQLLEGQSLFMRKKMIWAKKETNNH